MPGSSGRRTRVGGGDAVSVQEVRRKTHRGRKEEGGETVKPALVLVVAAGCCGVTVGCGFVLSDPLRSCRVFWRSFLYGQFYGQSCCGISGIVGISFI